MTDLTLFGAKHVYDDASEKYREAADTGWPHVVANAVKFAGLERGDSYFDAACGPGGATILGAQAVGPTGRAVGTDISTRMLDIARARADALGLKVEFHEDDFRFPPYHPETYNGVTCVFGIFFADDVRAVLARLWRLVKPGGRLVVVTLTGEFFSPLFDIFLQAATNATGRDLRFLMPWGLTQSPEVMGDHFRHVGADPVVLTDSALIPLDGPATWDLIEEGTGIRRIAEEIGPIAAAQARAAVHAYMEATNPRAVRLGAVYAIAQKPSRAAELVTMAGVAEPASRG